MVVVPEGDNRERLLCPDCGFIQYQNPLIVVGAVCHWQQRILLCRRAIEPRRGYWTMPAGYLELHESTEQGAMREAWEEARAQIEIEALLAVYSVLTISQVQLVYRARLLSGDVSPGPESLEVHLFEWNALPWEQLAFPSVRWALQHYAQSRALQQFAPFVKPTGESEELE
ncbi:NUDIX hydrolase [Gloeobacter kilaueensis JS1]|uniref:NUDIX hydrolase n=1 Tax=Gloeobacter kilaueensis (strain ATCC BAA-2537 / CCAP 1431/1 / ULC 316 / JS1) TaxID=1183438 RepID=U5QMR9_GLOK1|nr:NUDIX hydrolase [Gloeobacter kilaueensis JS1]